MSWFDRQDLAAAIRQEAQQTTTPTARTAPRAFGQPVGGGRPEEADARDGERQRENDERQLVRATHGLLHYRLMPLMDAAATGAALPPIDGPAPAACRSAAPEVGSRLASSRAARVACAAASTRTCAWRSP